ncbi:MAG: hypothetical protein HYW70_02730 [Candidatus Nealsonbacteria bacterium]|nr:hypothetical protein [Candidatus Nealsonbacteria bacterium]
MQKSFKKALFVILAVSFLITTPSIILYSQGYRFDFEQKKLVQTGAFYFKTRPDNAEVFVSGKPKKKTSFLFGNALIENLLPKNYEIEIQKEGYFPWKKNLPIKEKMVTEIKNIVLFPENPEFSLLDENGKEFWFSLLEKEKSNNGTTKKIKDAKTKDILDEAKGFMFSPDNKKVAYFNDYEIWLYFLEEDLGQPRHEAKEKVFLTRFSEKIGNVFWADNYYLLFNAGDKIKISETDTRDGLNIIDLTEFKDPKIFFSQGDNRLYVLSEGKVFASKKLLP